MKSLFFKQFTPVLVAVVMIFSINVQAQTYKIGDMHPCGGIVFSVDATGQKGFVANPADLGKYKFADAGKAITEKLGTGWTMPNKDQLNQMYLNLHKKGLGNFKPEKYRSGQASSYPMYPWAQNFANGTQEGDGLNNLTNVRAIKAFPCSTTYKIGDMHPCGGIVFTVDATGQKGFVANPADLGKYNFADAGKAITEKLGAGWTMPNKDQLNLMYVNLHKKGLGNFKPEKYRSGQASSYPMYPWAQNFANGTQEGDGLNNLTNIRAIKAFPCK